MAIAQTVQGSVQKPQYARPKQAAAHFQISRSTLWAWIKREGFPAPIRAGKKVTLLDLNAMEVYFKAHSEKGGK